MLVSEMDILVKILSLVFNDYRLTLCVWCQERDRGTSGVKYCLFCNVYIQV